MLPFNDLLPWMLLIFCWKRLYSVFKRLNIWFSHPGILQLIRSWRLHRVSGGPGSSCGSHHHSWCGQQVSNKCVPFLPWGVEVVRPVDGAPQWPGPLAHHHLQRRQQRHYALHQARAIQAPGPLWWRGGENSLKRLRTKYWCSGDQLGQQQSVRHQLLSREDRGHLRWVRHLQALREPQGGVSEKWFIEADELLHPRVHWASDLYGGTLDVRMWWEVTRQDKNE